MKNIYSKLNSKITIPLSTFLLLFCGIAKTQTISRSPDVSLSPANPANLSTLAATPPMGWNSWNYHLADINETIIKETADAIISSGMKSAGYEYIIIDDGWLTNIRDANGNLQFNKSIFPNGIKSVADYIHSKGLKIGIYEDVGSQTCQGLPGSKGYEQKDMNLFASWGIDFVKMDWCNTNGQTAKDSYTLINNCIKNTGREMLLSICEWGQSKPWTWAKGIGQMWRTT
ncbi:MAG: glycoside hydrolase family 27 protein, partial [Bacteroidetes bacterium]|nr:glycoside hydrolase family 27 protein [Bacteroidota bacterium]